MTKLVIRFLTLTIFATPLIAPPMITHADAATGHGKHAKKHARLVQRAPAVRDAGKNPFTSNYGEDFDRRNTGGGGY